MLSKIRPTGTQYLLEVRIIFRFINSGIELLSVENTKN